MLISEFMENLANLEPKEWVHLFFVLQEIMASTQPKTEIGKENNRRALTIVEEALRKMNQPRRLLELGLQRVEELVLPLEGLPKTLREEVNNWPDTKRRGLLRSVNVAKADFDKIMALGY